MATQSAVANRLVAPSGGTAPNAPNEDGGANVGADAEAAIAAAVAQVRPARAKHKSKQGDQAAWRVGASEKKDDETLAYYELTPEETYEVYTRTHRVLNLLNQGNYGLSELKQKYVPKGSKVAEPIGKLLDKYLAGRRRPPEELQDNGLNSAWQPASIHRDHARPIHATMIVVRAC